MLVEHTTASANVARDLQATALQHRLHFVAAPVGRGEWRADGDVQRRRRCVRARSAGGHRIHAA